MEIKQLKKFLETYHVDFDDKKVAQFSLYSELLEEWNQKMNLTALAKEDFVEKHFLDSLLLVKTHGFKSQSIMDLGSGAGFPGIPLKIVFPELNLFLVEPTQKRCLFLQELVEKLDLKDVTIVNKRAEDLERSMRESFDIVVARAVASLPIILELAIPYLKIDGVFIALKGPSGLEELEKSKKALKTLQVKHIKTDTHQLESDSAIRNNLVFLKLKETNDKFPRTYAQIKRKPL